ncbi:MAG TPA: GntR family transcriptional regulator [Deltaproteobacteria bacterium]|nr:GntR family transcriptional regulator [Deltaproteobacteria bacterium]
MKTKKERLPVYQNIKTEMREWIQTGIWKQGGLIPVEAALAKEFGCARATVNRALRELAQEGILERRRKAGTRVVMPVGRSANFEIPRIRLEIEETGATYRYALLLREVTVPTANVRNKLETSQEIRSLHLHCLHYSNEAPFQFEDRWINLKSIPEVEETIQMNGWSSMYPGQMLNIFFLQPMPIWNKPNCFLWQNVMRFS